MMVMPRRQTPPPTTSQTVGRTESTSQSQRRATVIYTPPYAAETRPAAVGCNDKSHANRARLHAAGTSNHAEPCWLSPRDGREHRTIAAEAVRMKRPLQPPRAASIAPMPIFLIVILASNQRFATA